MSPLTEITIIKMKSRKRFACKDFAGKRSRRRKRRQVGQMPDLSHTSPCGDVVGAVRLELMTSCMSSMRSNQLSYVPERLS